MKNTILKRSHIWILIFFFLHCPLISNAQTTDAIAEKSQQMLTNDNQLTEVENNSSPKATESIEPNNALNDTKPLDFGDVAPKPLSKVKFLFGVYYNFADEMRSDDLTVTSSTDTKKGSAYSTWENGFGISLGACIPDIANNFGFEVTGFYDLARRSKQFKTILEGVETVTSNDTLTFSTIGLYSNIVYSSDNSTFFFGGVNIHDPTFTGISTSAISSSESGLIGWQLGLRKKFTDKVYLEGQYRSIIYNTSSSASALSLSSRTTNELNGFVLSLRFEL